MSILFTDAEILLRRNGTYESLKNACLGVQGDKISYIGTEHPKEKYDTVRKMHGKLLMPGLINCHNHAAMVLLRGVGSGLKLQEWLFDNIIPAEERLDEEIVAAANTYAVMEMLAGGTTSFSDMYFYAWRMPPVIVDTGIRGNLCRVVECFDENQTPEQNIQLGEARSLYENFNGLGDGRVKVDFCIHAEYTCKEKIARACAEMCAGYHGRMHIHLAETVREQQECIERYGITPTAWFEKMGVFANPTSAAHCVAVTEEDREILRRNGVTAVHNPTSNMKLGSGFAPVPELLADGINVALGTDGTASNNNLNMFEEMHLASLIHNGCHSDPTAITAQNVLDMATVNGAKSQGREDIGVLEVGKKADIIALDLDKPHLYPNFDTPALLAYSAQGSDVCMTMVDGKILYENGAFLTIDEEKARAEMAQAVAKMFP